MRSSGDDFLEVIVTNGLLMLKSFCMQYGYWFLSGIGCCLQIWQQITFANQIKCSYFSLLDASEVKYLLGFCGVDLLQHKVLMVMVNEFFQSG